MDALIVVAGATGNLGRRLVRELFARKARVRALVRSRNAEAMALQRQGVELYDADFSSQASLAEGCMGARCVVSTVSGLRDVIVDGQERLVDAAISAGCKGFIPSDFALDFTNLVRGTNRNLDLRRELMERIEDKDIALTSVLNGAFMELLLGPAPFLVFPLRRAVYFGEATMPLDFTAMDDVAKYTSYAAIDDTTPRFLRIAGDVVTSEQLAEAATRATGKRFKTFRAGTCTGWSSSSGSCGGSAARTRCSRRGRACSTRATCSTAAGSSRRSTTIAIRRCGSRL